jgi:transcriptional regulator with XRE-family HTH domain
MDRIRQLRMERGLSQAKLAVMADMDPATLNRLERGTGNPNLKTLQRIADALDISVAELVEDVSPKAQAPLFRELPDPATQEGRRYPETVLTTESWSYQALDSWVRTIRDLIAEYEPIIGGLPEKPSLEVFLETRMKLVPLGKYADSINEALWESGVIKSFNELWAAVKAGEQLPQDLERKVREFRSVVEELNSELMPPAIQWLLASLDWLRGRPEPEQSEIRKFRKQLEGLETQVNLWAPKYGPAVRQRERVHKNETA